jgi:hypothetical protein
VFEDAGISGSKCRDQRPAFDRLHRAIARREVDIVMAWSVDRRGRSLQDLVAFLAELRAAGIVSTCTSGALIRPRPPAAPCSICLRLRGIREGDHCRTSARRHRPRPRTGQAPRTAADQR